MKPVLFKDFVQIKKAEKMLIEKYDKLLPDEIIYLWRTYGFGTFYNGYLKVINPDDFIVSLEKSYFQGYVSIPIFATAFGDLITWEKNHFVGIVKYRYGDNDIISDGFEFFIDDVTDGELDEEYLSIRQYNEAIKKYGSLEYDECFGYVPLLALGGKESVDNLKKVKIREHIALVTEMVGEI